MRIVLIGSTGLIGRHLADRLLERGHEVRALLRRPTGREAPGWQEWVAPASDWPALVRQTGGDVAISALGTTMRAAGSRQGFRAVDHDLVHAFATAARAAGISHMVLVSSVGASSGSRNFYLRVKGEVEAALREIGFDRLDLVRPGLLRGDRGADRRLKERIAIAASPLLDLVLRGPLDRYGSIAASQVADAVARLAEQDAPGTFVHENRALRALVRG